MHRRRLNIGGMDAALLTLDLPTLKARLAEAVAAMHALAIGAREVSVAKNDVRVQYNELNKTALQEYIGQLNAAVRYKEVGAPQRAPIYITL